MPEWLEVIFLIIMWILGFHIGTLRQGEVSGRSVMIPSIFHNKIFKTANWWERIILWFIKEESVTADNPGLYTTIYFKHWKGRIYFTKAVHSFTLGSLEREKKP